MPILKTHLSNL